MDKNIPLSKLIRIGSKLTGQCFRKIHEDSKTCAIGAAFLAKFVEIPYGLNTREAAEALNIPLELGKEIITLNDMCRWTREKIADRLEERGL